ncbi:MAG: methyltransferase domain-containing protein [Desulfobacteraceae bacterium]|nr:MAG: methyltransferase domain-containing protein [Desulfobacteraceae bacterium]
MTRHDDTSYGPNPLILKYLDLFPSSENKLPILDLACGDGHNGIYLASKGWSVILADRSEETLAKAKEQALKNHMTAKFWQVDFEEPGFNQLEENTLGGVLIFRYLFRPLIPAIKKAIVKGGFLFYETFTWDHLQFHPTFNPEFLLKTGELPKWFPDWEILHSFEGILENPDRAVAQLVCRKPDQKKVHG